MRATHTGNQQKIPGIAVSAILVTFGHPIEDIAGAVRSIERAAAPAEICLEIVVVDNLGDQRVSTLPGIRYICPGSNLGFAGGANLGAREASGRYLLFCGVDSCLAEGALKLLLEAALVFGDAHIYSAILRKGGVLQRDAYLPWRTPTSRRIMHYRKRRLLQSIDQGVRGSVVRVRKICGGSMFVSSVRFAHLEGFDESFLAYGEDLEISFRHMNSGGQILAVCGAEIFHDGCSVGGRESALVARCQVDALARVCSLTSGPPLRYLVLLELLFYNIGATIFDLFRCRSVVNRRAKFREIYRWAAWNIAEPLSGAAGFPWPSALSAKVEPNDG
jgi:GT2 family glycosyltransferase